MRGRAREHGDQCKKTDIVVQVHVQQSLPNMLRRQHKQMHTYVILLQRHSRILPIHSLEYLEIILKPFSSSLELGPCSTSPRPRGCSENHISSSFSAPSKNPTSSTEMVEFSLFLVLLCVMLSRHLAAASSLGRLS